MSREAFCLDPCDPPFGRCVNCQGLVDVRDFDAELCPTCSESLASPEAVVMLTDAEATLMDGRCPWCGEQSTFRWSDDTATLRVDDTDARLDYVLEGHIICQHCGFGFAGSGQGSDATPDWRRITEVVTEGDEELRSDPSVELPGEE